MYLTPRINEWFYCNRKRKKESTDLDSINGSVPSKWISEQRAPVQLVFKEKQSEHRNILSENDWLDLLKDTFKPL